MSLPEALNLRWNAAEAADTVFELGLPSSVFMETRSNIFPSDLLLRMLAQVAGKGFGGNFPAHTLEWEPVGIRIASVEEALLITHPQGYIDDTEPFIISKESLPKLSYHGDIEFIIEKVI